MFGTERVSMEGTTFIRRTRTRCFGFLKQGTLGKPEIIGKSGQTSKNQWLFLVPIIKDGGWHITPQKAIHIICTKLQIYKCYISGTYCQLGDGLCHRSHLLRQPKTTIEKTVSCLIFDLHLPRPGKVVTVVTEMVRRKLFTRPC